MDVLEKRGIKVIKYLGSGAFSNTYLCIFDGQEVAIKVPNERYNSRKKLHFLEYEIKLLDMFRSSKHIVTMLYSNVAPHNSFVIFEALGPSLYEFICSHKKRMPPDVIKRIAGQILSGLTELKGRGVLHGDLKPENILLSGNTIRLIDLGNAVIKANFSKYKYPIQTRHYRPPECIIRAPFDYSADMWAFGCIVYEMITGHMMFAPKRDNDMSVNACHLGKLLKAGKRSHRYFDAGDDYIYKFRYLLGRRQPMFDLLLHWKIPEVEARLWADFLAPIFTYNIKKRMTPEEALLKIGPLFD
jgi:serine/threonine protein kinase